MRDFLNDALDHRDAGLGRAQGPERPALPKRFYKQAAYRAEGEGYAITLDGRPTKTPGQVPVVVPVLALAEQLVEEWAAQGDEIDPGTMPHVRLINAALEGGAASRDALVAEIMQYAGSDLLLYRADTPVELVALQDEKWDAVLVKLARHHCVSFLPTVGIIHRAQPPETLARLHASIADAGFIEGAALVSITGLTGSGLLAIALRHGLVDRDAAWAAAHLDEDYQASLWGADHEAVRRRTRRRTEYDAAVNVLAWVAG